MIRNEVFFNLLKSNGIEFFTGVPDSSLKHFCAYITDHTNESNHIIAANEGGAVALASGYYLATGKPALVYMQNSGQGNSINPLASLADPEIYSIPMLLLVGWRGEPGIKDEPQHKKQGRITLQLLETLEIPHFVLPKEEKDANEIINKSIQLLNKYSAPVALVARKGTFEEYPFSVTDSNYLVSREEAISIILEQLSEKDIIVSTTGKTSREIYEYRDFNRQTHERDFLTIGSMGHTSMIAMGIAMQKRDRQTFCLDGDGAAIMHMGSMAIIGANGVNNFKHIIFNNGAHESVGGQPTVAQKISLTDIAKACGYKHTFNAKTKEEIEKSVKLLKESAGPALLEIFIKQGSRPDLGRPKTTPLENKEAFMKFLQK